jgi:hypothetical protein
MISLPKYNRFDSDIFYTADWMLMDCYDRWSDIDDRFGSE